jgi:hypothetical protein
MNNAETVADHATATLASHRPATAVHPLEQSRSKQDHAALQQDAERLRAARSVVREEPRAPLRGDVAIPGSRPSRILVPSAAFQKRR